MPNWTPEQKAAIDLDNSNIIVSAGAGSGKTLVLTTRVIRKLESGIPINKLLVLTFTNDAAKEMKSRIRKAIKKIPSLKKELDLLDSSYITTFDSYSLSLVKKYNYLLNVSRNIKIIDSSIVNIKKKEFIDDIFNYLYSTKDEDFLSFINDFCIKDDIEIKKYILGINNSLEMKYDKSNYLKKYIEDYYNDNYISKIINFYLELIYDKFDRIKKLYRQVLTSETDKNIKKYIESYETLINSQNYVEIKENLKVNHPKYINSKEERDEIKKLIEQLKELTIYKDELELKSSYKSTEKYVRVIIKIIEMLDEKINKYKAENEAYEFIDISKMAIKLVLDYPDIRDEIKTSYNEIMVDEYQDTNDLQEMFITAISNDNVYMVGDIKQSIYRFRNSNPDIFKNKYDNYSSNTGGRKIDLVKNFRSRDEVLIDINKIFDILMEDKYGGADYKKSHRMVFGQDNYIKNNDINFSNHLDIYTYSTDELRNFTNAEKEAFIIARDIKEKIKNKYKVIDKDTDEFRNIKYEDFCIIIDRTSDFDLYRQIFEYENIPLVPIKDEVLTTSYDILIIKNIISLIIKIKDNKFDKEFKYYVVSILRSFLYNEDDNKIFDMFKNNRFKETDLFKKSKNISYRLDELTPHSFIEMILKEFNFYEKALTYHDMDKLDVRLSYLLKLTKDLESLGYTPYDLKDYITLMIESDDEIKYKINTDVKGISIITIHRSKGLEYPVCYFPGLYKEFNIKDIKDEILYDKNYGIITEYYNNGVGTLFTKKLAKEKYMEEEISEKIRLFYVALTRAREKIIMVFPEGLKNVPKKEVKSFYELISPIKDLFNTEYKDLKDIVSKDYTLFKTKNLDYLKTDDKVIEKEIKVSKNILEKKHYSKVNNELKVIDELKSMKYGTDIHYLFEVTNLKEKTDIKEINNFLNHDEVKDIKNSKIYKEYEFMYEKDNKLYHGVIDLMLIYSDHIDIIDYKLSDINDKNYDKQLRGYRDYIKEKTDLPINMYLYSINKDVFRKLSE